MSAFPQANRAYTNVMERLVAEEVARQIDEAPRQYWKTLTPITKLKCGITSGKKLKAIEEIFYVDPEPLPEIITDKKLLNSFSATELKTMAKERGIKGYSKLKKADLVKSLASD